MSSSLGVEFEADFTMDLFADLTPMSELQLYDSQNDIAMSSTEVPPSDKQLEIEQKLVTENIPEDNLTMNMMPMEPLDPVLELNEPVTGAITPPPSDDEKIDGEIIFSVDAQVDYSSDPEEEQPLEEIIDTSIDPETIRLMVIVSMVKPFEDGADTLVHAGDFIIEVTPTTTIREIKYGITNTLDICYEDMALVFVGKFLSDARTVAYYFIDDGQTLHLLVESPNKLFKDIFEEFKRLNLSEERAWFATRSFIHILHNKYNIEGSDDDETPTLTEELLLHELEQIYVPGSDESDDSSADEDDNDPKENEMIIVGTMELEFVMESEEDDSDEEEFVNDEHNSEDEQDNSDPEDENSEDEEDGEDGEDGEDDGNLDDDESVFENDVDEILVINSQTIIMLASEE